LSKKAEELRKNAHVKAISRLPTAAEKTEIEAQKRKQTLSSATELFSSRMPAKMQRLEVSTQQSGTGKQLAWQQNSGRGIEDLGAVSMPLEVVETQDLELFELQWFEEVTGQAKAIAGATQETAIDLCELDTQENEWARVYTERAARVLEEKVGQEPEEKEEEEEEEEKTEDEEAEESPLSWYDQFDTQDTVLL